MDLKQQDAAHLKTMKQDLRQAHFSMGNEKPTFHTEANGMVEH